MGSCHRGGTFNCLIASDYFVIFCHILQPFVTFCNRSRLLISGRVQTAMPHTYPAAHAPCNTLILLGTLWPYLALGHHSKLLISLVSLWP